MSELIREALIRDPDYVLAKTKMLKTVCKHSASISALRPPQKAFAESYRKSVQHLEHLRGASLFYPFIGSGMGNGAFVELADGSIKYDFISGIGVHFGHCHPKVIEASIEAAVEDIAIQGNLLQNESSLALSELLVKCSGLPHCFLSSSGAMANENALKLAFQKKAPSSRVLAFKNGNMGRTLALSQITDKPIYREGLPVTLAVDYIPFYDEKDPHGSTEKAIIALKSHLARHSKAHACMCFELIQGEAGNYPGSRDFFMSLISILKEEDIPILIDEVQSFARTDHLFAFQHFGLEEHVDIVTIGKLAHTCATLFSRGLCPKPELLSQTFTAPTSSIKCGIAIIKSLLEEGYLGKAGKNTQISKHFVDHLEAMAKRHPECMEGPFGYGLMIGFTPFKGDEKKVLQFAKALFEAGLIVYIAGENPTRIRMLPPAGGITFAMIDEAMAILEKTLMNLLSLSP